MILHKVKMIGFRNFKDSEINLNQQTLLIGANDVGKTNFIYALRLLLDRSLSDADLDPSDKDFYVYDDTCNEFSITLYFKEIKEDCLLSKLKESIKDGNFILKYVGERNPKTNEKNYKIYAGYDDTPEGLDDEINSRFYLKVLNMKYISSRRDLMSYIKKEKRLLLEDVRGERTDDCIDADNNGEKKIKENLNTISGEIKELSYIKNATNKLNIEMKKLSVANEPLNLVFDVPTTDVKNYVDTLHLGIKINDQMVSIGGDGRNNQAYLALWASRNKLRDSDIKEVSIFAIEEPEAHLHPHQQRKLAKYLYKDVSNQLILTSHSPQIACEFAPNSLIRLFPENNSTSAANNGCSVDVEKRFEEFAHRLNLISSEAFFSDAVLLVEGVSEELFYKAYSDAVSVDLDFYNISIINVGGIGFIPYVKLLNQLKIKWVAKTDLDISKVPKIKEYRLAGIDRGLDLLEFMGVKPGIEKNNIRSTSNSISSFDANLVDSALKLLGQNNIFVSDVDLETDLYNSEIRCYLDDFYEAEDVIKAMKEAKGENMYRFLKDNYDNLKLMINKDSSLLKRFFTCISLIKCYETQTNQ